MDQKERWSWNLGLESERRENYLRFPNPNVKTKGGGLQSNGAFSIVLLSTGSTRRHTWLGALLSILPNM